MDIGVGVDIEEVARFSKMMSEPQRMTFRRIFTESELKYCFAQACPEQHLAARFAAKEAVIKGLGYFDLGPLELTAIEIVKDHAGAPVVVFKADSVQERFLIRVSLSHCKGMAIAMAVLIDRQGDAGNGNSAWRCGC